MKKILLVLACALILPVTLFAQYAPPAGGFPDMSQYGDFSGGTPDMSQFGGIPEGMQSMMEKGFAMLKKSVGNMKKATIQMDKSIDKVTKAGYAVPAGVAESLAKAKAAIATIEAATTFTDDVTNALGDFNDFVDVLDQNIESMNMLANFPRILKQADRTILKLIKNFDKVKAKFEKNGVDAGSASADVQKQIDALNTTLAAAKQSALDGKAEEAFDALDDTFFPGLEDAFQSVGMLDAINSLTRGAVRVIEKGIAKAEKLVAKVEAQGKDVTVARDAITKSKAKLEELKTLLKSKDFDPDDAVALVEELDGYRTDFEDAMEEITGKQLEGTNSITFSNMKAPLPPKEIRGEFPQGGDSGFEKIDLGF